MTSSEILQKVKDIEFINPKLLILHYNTQALMDYIANRYDILTEYSTPILYPYKAGTYSGNSTSMHYRSSLFFPNNYEEYINNKSKFKDYENYIKKFVLRYSVFVKPPFKTFDLFIKNTNDTYRIYSNRNLLEVVADSITQFFGHTTGIVHCKISHEMTDLPFHSAYYSNLFVSTPQIYYSTFEDVLYMQRIYNFLLFASRCYIQHYRFLIKYLFLNPKSNHKLVQKMQLVKGFVTTLADEMSNSFGDYPYIFREYAIKDLGTYKYDINPSLSNLNYVLETGVNY